MKLRPGTYHLVGCLVVLASAIAVLLVVFPALVASYVPKAVRLVGLRSEAGYFLFVALVPVLVWLVPPLVRGLARLTHHGHRAFLGKDGFYIRFSVPRPLRFRDTVVRALSPFAINLLVISEIEYFMGGTDLATPARGFLAFPLLLLAGAVTSLLPGPWLVDALDLRLVNPAKGEVVREASVFEGLLGPLGALALLVSFITLAHTVGDSYVQGLVLLGLWAARMFPAVVVAVSVYRIFIEPDVLPSLEAWATKEGIEVTPSLETALRRLQPSPASPVPEPTASAPADAAEAREPRS